ncbi:hypothetical protein KM043_016253 [Ampulex compressa]|nr:hypothetical protein KM043_016253 [Ampulex compressa]
MSDQFWLRADAAAGLSTDTIAELYFRSSRKVAAVEITGGKDGQVREKQKRDAVDNSLAFDQAFWPLLEAPSGGSDFHQSKVPAVRSRRGGRPRRGAKGPRQAADGKGQKYGLKKTRNIYTTEIRQDVKIQIVLIIIYFTLPSMAPLHLDEIPLTSGSQKGVPTSQCGEHRPTSKIRELEQGRKTV